MSDLDSADDIFGDSEKNQFSDGDDVNGKRKEDANAEDENGMP